MKDELDELSLDPQDWSETRALAHQMLDQVFDDLENVRSRPVWQRLPDAAKASPGASAKSSATKRRSSVVHNRR